MSADLQRRSDEALNGKARFGLGLLAFQAVGREGLETMVFTLAIVFASSTQAATTAHGHGLLLGAVLGLAVALVDRLRHLQAGPTPQSGPVLPDHRRRAHGLRRRAAGRCRREHAGAGLAPVPRAAICGTPARYLSEDSSLG